MRVFVQYPEGLKNKLWEIKKKLEEQGYEVIFDNEPTYGFCDLKDDEALRLGCQAIIHIGHNAFGFEHLLKKSKVKVIIWEWKYDVDKEKVDRILKKEINKIRDYKRVGIVSSLQYLNYVYYLKEKLKELGFEPIVPKNPQILGCNIANARIIENRVDIFLVPTEGKFYPLGLALETDKPVFAFDLEKEQIISMEKERKKYLTVKYYYLEKFKEAKKVALLVSWKKGQMFYDPFKVKEELEKMGKEVIILAMDEVDERKLIGIDVDFYINLACPRIFDGFERFEKPILNWKDIIQWRRSLHQSSED